MINPITSQIAVVQNSPERKMGWSAAHVHHAHMWDINMINFAHGNDILVMHHDSHGHPVKRAKAAQLTLLMY